jgi:hypothetical protein
VITYRCDRCGAETTPDKLYEVELIFTPRDLDGALHTDAEDRKTLGDLCANCTDVIEPLVEALVKPIAAPAVREAVDDADRAPFAIDPSSSCVHGAVHEDGRCLSCGQLVRVSWGDTREKAE